MLPVKIMLPRDLCRWFLAMLAVGALLSLAACGGNQEAGNKTVFAAMPPQAAPAMTDVQIVNGKRENYTVSKISIGYIITDMQNNSDIVVAKNKKQLRFTDLTVNLEIGDLSTQVNANQLRSIIDLYVAFFNRVPDADGLAYWLQQLKAGTSLDQISNSFYRAAILYSAQTGYSSEMSNQEFVKIIYKNVLGRSGSFAPSDAEVNYWAGELVRGVSKGSMIQAMLNSARTFYNDPKWSFVPALLDGKLQVAKYFAVEHGLTYISPEDSIVKTMAIAAAVTPSDTNNARALVPVKDLTTNLAAAPSFENVAGICTPAAERAWARGHLDDVYLWYKDIAETPQNKLMDASIYFDSLLVRSKDRFSFAIPQKEIDDYFQSGTSFSYGYSLQREGTRLRVLFVQPGSPADLAGLKRGATIASVDNTSLAQPANDDQYAALYPSKAETHTFSIVDLDGITARNVQMTAASIVDSPVLESKILVDQGRKIGYIMFNDHIRTAEQALINSINSFREARVNDVVLDVRYNGGGYLYIANELSAMIGGYRTAGHIFETLTSNDKYQQNADESTSWFYSYDTKSQVLPWLNLPRVFVLTSSRTCSASESIINGLSPFLEVIIIGENTCGKPYGFFQTNNCNTAYFAIAFSGVNELGKGDYVNGFAPTCQVADDLDHLLGDPNERRLSAALHYARTGNCPAPSGFSRLAMPPSQAGERDPYPWRRIRLVQ
ncbi:DUF4214 domain-containing protein [Undibacterium flavidum]|uniref:DUF4214 domain-containing protein n=1 Tax=Undibacterium flavidum TaxID=2762297 RepID=A0ABR6YBR0_9BURK|nr:DUF4214 domain-containing protein [Undibacterium flavidum]MBC3873682.1 DUF4214 domain-containing protein [Undibacterium flavidum]